MRDHRDGLMLGGAVFAVLLLLLFISPSGCVIAGVLIALYEIALSRLGHEPESSGMA